MATSYAFRPLPNGARRVSVGDQAVVFDVPDTTQRDLSLWIENRGNSELLIEVGNIVPDDSLSFPIPAQSSQPIGVWSTRVIQLKRPAGSVPEEVVVTAGEGL